MVVPPTRRRLLRRSGIALASLVTSGTATASREWGRSTSDHEGDWPVAGQDEGRTYHNEHAPGPGGTVGADWTFETVGDTHGTKLGAVVDGTGYVGDYRRGAWAVDLDTGETVWNREFGGCFTPILHDGVVVGAGGDGTGHAVGMDPDDGDVRWQVETEHSYAYTPVATDGRCIFGGADPALIVALDVRTGTKQWDFDPGSEFDSVSTYCLTDELVICAANRDADESEDRHTGAGKFVALDYRNGDLEWTLDVSDQSAFGCHAADGRLVLVLGHPGEIRVLDAETNATRWSDAASGVSDVAVGDDAIYAVGDGPANVRALDPATGETRWTTWLPETAYAHQPALGMADVYVATVTLGDGANRYEVVALEQSSGEVRWRQEIADYPYDPSVVDDTVYVDGVSISNPYGFVTAISGSRDREIPLDASFVYSPDSPQVGDEVTFDASRTTDPDDDVESYRWDLTGDGTVDATGRTVTHVFEEAGTYDVRLHVRDGRGATATTERRVSVGRPFRPGTHGFGFRNWSTGSSRFAAHDHEAVSLGEVKQVMKDSWIDRISAVLGRTIPASSLALEAIALEVYLNVNQGSATNGHCYGMVYAADEYYRNPDEFPAGVDVASEVPEPVGKYADVGTAIDYHHNTQVLDFAVWGTRRLVFGNQPIDYDVQLTAITDAVDETGTAGLSLHSTARGLSHQIMATGYERHGDAVEVEVYDPNDPAGAYESGRLTRTVTFDESGSRTTVEPYDGHYDRIAYTNADGRVDLPAMLRVARLQAIGWFVDLLTSAVAFLTKSPVDLRVTGPNGEQLQRFDAELATLEPTEYDHARTLAPAPPGEYDVELVGTDDGEYTLEVVGQSSDGEPISDVVDGRISEGETHSFSANAGADEDEPVLRRTDDADGSATGSLPLGGLGVGTGVSVLAYGAYRYLSSDEENDPHQPPPEAEGRPGEYDHGVGPSGRRRGDGRQHGRGAGAGRGRDAGQQPDPGASGQRPESRSNGPQGPETGASGRRPESRPDGQQGRSCPRCGARVSGSMRTCPECGHDLTYR